MTETTLYISSPKTPGPPIMASVKEFDSTDLIIRVWPDVEGWLHLSADVTFGRKFGAKTPTATVNWSAMGAQAPETAERYAAVMLATAGIAKSLNKDGSIGSGWVRVPTEEEG